MPVNLVFDLGGVVFRWQPDEFLTRLLPQRASSRAAGRRLAGEFFQSFGGAWGEFDRGRIEPGPLSELIAARLGLTVADVRCVIDAIPDELQPIPETAALLQRLRASGQPLFFLSNMPVAYADHLEAKHDVLRLFERGVFSSRVGIIKPDPKIFTHAAEVFGAEPDELLLIDDIEGNIDAARRAGWRGLLFRNAAQCESDLADAGRSRGK